MNRMLLTVSECVLLTGASRRAIFSAIASGALVSTKLSGRRRRIQVVELERWIGHPLNLPTAAE
jgi:excisionase family DNA binding protein